MCRCFVPAGATGAVLTDVDVIHQPVTIEEALPYERHSRDTNISLSRKLVNKVSVNSVF